MDEEGWMLGHEANSSSNVERYSDWIRQLHEFTGLILLGNLVPDVSEVPIPSDPRRKAAVQRGLDLEFSRAQQSLREVIKQPNADTGEHYQRLLRRIVIDPKLNAPYSYPKPARIPAMNDPRRLRACLMHKYHKDEVIGTLGDNDLVTADSSSWPVLEIDMTNWPESKSCCVKLHPRQDLARRRSTNDSVVEEGDDVLSNLSFEIIEDRTRRNSDELADNFSGSMLEPDETCVIMAKVTSAPADLPNEWCKVYDEEPDEPIIRVKEEPVQFRPMPRSDDEPAELIELSSDDDDIDETRRNIELLDIDDEVNANLHPRRSAATASRYLQEPVDKATEVIDIDSDDDEDTFFNISAWEMEELVSVKNETPETQAVGEGIRVRKLSTMKDTLHAAPRKSDSSKKGRRANDEKRARHTKKSRTPDNFANDQNICIQNDTLPFERAEASGNTSSPNSPEGPTVGSEKIIGTPITLRRLSNLVRSQLDTADSVIQESRAIRAEAERQHTSSAAVVQPLAPTQNVYDFDLGASDGVAAGVESEVENETESDSNIRLHIARLEDVRKRDALSFPENVDPYPVDLNSDDDEGQETVDGPDERSPCDDTTDKTASSQACPSVAVKSRYTFRTLQEIMDSYLRGSDDDATSSDTLENAENTNADPVDCNANNEVPSFMDPVDTAWLASLYDKYFTKPLSSDKTLEGQKENDITDKADENTNETNEETSPRLDVHLAPGDNKDEDQPMNEVENVNRSLSTAASVNVINSGTGTLVPWRSDKLSGPESLSGLNQMFTIGDGRKRGATVYDEEDSQLDVYPPTKRFKAVWDFGRSVRATYYSGVQGVHVDLEQLLTQFVHYARNYDLVVNGLSYFIKDRPGLSILAYVQLHQQVMRNQSFWRDRCTYWSEENKCAAMDTSTTIWQKSGDKLSIEELPEEENHNVDYKLSCHECTKNEETVDPESVEKWKSRISSKVDVNSNHNKPHLHPEFTVLVKEKHKHRVRKHRTKPKDEELTAVSFIRDPPIKQSKQDIYLNPTALENYTFADNISKGLTSDGLSIRKSHVKCVEPRIENREKLKGLLDKEVPELDSNDYENNPVNIHTHKYKLCIKSEFLQSKTKKKKSKSTDLCTFQDFSHKPKKRKLSEEFTSKRVEKNTFSNNLTIESSVDQSIQSINTNKIEKLDVLSEQINQFVLKLIQPVNTNDVTPNEMFYRRDYPKSYYEESDIESNEKCNFTYSYASSTTENLNLNLEGNENRKPVEAEESHKNNTFFSNNNYNTSVDSLNVDCGYDNVHFKKNVEYNLKENNIHIDKENYETVALNNLDSGNENMGDTDTTESDSLVSSNTFKSTSVNIAENNLNNSVTTFITSDLYDKNSRKSIDANEGSINTDNCKVVDSMSISSKLESYCSKSTSTNEVLSKCDQSTLDNSNESECCNKKSSDLLISDSKNNSDNYKRDNCLSFSDTSNQNNTSLCKSPPLKLNRTWPKGNRSSSSKQRLHEHLSDSLTDKTTETNCKQLHESDQRISAESEISTTKNIADIQTELQVPFNNSNIEETSDSNKNNINSGNDESCGILDSIKHSSEAETKTKTTDVKNNSNDSNVLVNENNLEESSNKSTELSDKEMENENERILINTKESLPKFDSLKSNNVTLGESDKTSRILENLTIGQSKETETASTIESDTIISYERSSEMHNIEESIQPESNTNNNLNKINLVQNIDHIKGTTKDSSTSIDSYTENSNVVTPENEKALSPVCDYINDNHEQNLTSPMSGNNNYEEGDFDFIINYNDSIDDDSELQSEHNIDLEEYCKTDLSTNSDESDIEFLIEIPSSKGVRIENTVQDIKPDVISLSNSTENIDETVTLSNGEKTIEINVPGGYCEADECLKLIIESCNKAANNEETISEERSLSNTDETPIESILDKNDTTTESTTTPILVENQPSSPVVDQCSNEVHSTTENESQKNQNVKLTKFTANINNDINDPQILKEFNLRRDIVAPDEIKVEPLEVNQPEIDDEENFSKSLDETCTKAIESFNNLANMQNLESIISNTDSSLLSVPSLSYLKTSLKSNLNNSVPLGNINVNYDDEFDKLPINEGNQLSNESLITNDITTNQVAYTEPMIKLRNINDMLQNSSSAETDQANLTQRLCTKESTTTNSNIENNENHLSTTSANSILNNSTPHSNQQENVLINVTQPQYQPLQQLAYLSQAVTTTVNSSYSIPNTSQAQNTTYKQTLVIPAVTVVAHNNQSAIVSIENRSRESINTQPPTMVYASSIFPQFFDSEKATSHGVIQESNVTLSSNQTRNNEGAASVINRRHTGHPAALFTNVLSISDINFEPLLKLSAMSRHISRYTLEQNLYFRRIFISNIKTSILDLKKCGSLKQLESNLKNCKNLTENTWKFHGHLVIIMESYVGFHCLCSDPEEIINSAILNSLPEEAQFIHHRNTSSLMDIKDIYRRLRRTNKIADISKKSLYSKIDRFLLQSSEMRMSKDQIQVLFQQIRCFQTIFKTNIEQQQSRNIT